jgi:hypothetical protein
MKHSKKKPLDELTVASRCPATIAVSPRSADPGADQDVHGERHGDRDPAEGELAQTGEQRRAASQAADVMPPASSGISAPEENVTWPDDGEVAAIERGDPDRALPFGDRDHGCVRPAQPQVSVSADQVLDALPVGDAEVCYFQLAVDDRRVQAGFRLGAKLPVDQVGGLCDDHGRGNQGTFIAL